MEKDGPLDGIKYNENNKDSQMGEVKPNFFLNIRLHFKIAWFEEPRFTLSRLLANSN